MSDTAHQSPLGVNAFGSLIQAIGLNINPVLSGYAGSSQSNEQYTLGTVCSDTCLRLLVYSINDAFKRGLVNTSTYNNLIGIGTATSSIVPTAITSDASTFTVTHDTNVISVMPVGSVVKIDGATPDAYNGSWLVVASATGNFTVASTTDPGPATVVGTVYFNSSIPALGDAMPLSYAWEGAPFWGGTLYTHSNPVTQWGFVRLLALEAWNDFNFNNGLSDTATYGDFLASFDAAVSFIDYSNQFILATSNSRYFLDGTFSNMNDLISGDITGVSLATKEFGIELANTGKAIDLATIDTFGMPSNLLATLQKNNGLTKSVTLAMLAIGLDTSQLSSILDGTTLPTVGQQKAMYDAFSIIVGPELQEILVPLNVKTPGITSLVDLLNPMKLFPTTYQSLTVPLYNTGTTNANSKIYYPIYGEGSVSSAITTPSVVAKVGTYTPPTKPPVYQSQTSTGSSGGYSDSQPEFVTGGSGSNSAPQPPYSPPGPPTGFAALPLTTRVEVLTEYCKYYNISTNGGGIPTVANGNKVQISIENPPPLSVDEWGAQWATSKGYLDSQGNSKV